VPGFLFRHKKYQFEQMNRNKQKKILAIINPISGTGKQKNIELLLNTYLDFEKFQLHTRYTGYAGHASKLAKEAMNEKYDAVLAVGGDGTINEIARSLTGSVVALAIIPCGSGNGLARHLGIPMKPVDAIKWLNMASCKKIDTVKINQDFFVNVGGIGFDAFISDQFEKMKTRGFQTYAKAVIKGFFTYPEQKFTVIQNNQKYFLKGFMLSFANSTQFGNNAFIAPNACIDDGQINLILIKKPKWFQVIGLAIKIFTKRTERSSLFTQLIGNEFLIHQNQKLAHVDGEPITIGKKIHLKVNPTSLHVFQTAI